MTRVRVGIAALLALVLAVGVRGDTKDKFDKKPDKPDKPPRERPDRPPGIGFPPPGGPFNMPLLSKRDLEALDLKADQKEKVDKIVKEYQDKQKSNRDKMQALMEKLKDKPDPDAAREMQTKMREMFTGFQKSRREAVDKIMAVLSDEQKKKFEEIQRSRPRFPGPSGGPFGPGPGAMFRPGQILPQPLREHLKLTKEQKEELDKLQKDVDARLKKLLTDEQRKMIERMTGRGGRPGFPPLPPPPPPPEKN